ncbi:RNA polymerase sigma factor SigJ [Streptomyces mashuensis]|nr:RNA polymerase sigma factor SigJ [Streptomyces mashuensis]
MASHTDFEDHRRHLWAVAYRITGSVADADDAVQEAWLRWHRLPDSVAEDPRRYLTTVVSRICYDQLGSARARRETYVGQWLPEPLVTGAGGSGRRPDGSDVEEQVALDESVGMALLVVLERLTPAERTAFVLHDLFSVSFPEIADVIERTPESVRQLASRARKRVRAEAPRRSVDREEHRRAVEAFLAASTGGELADLMEVLDPDVVWRADGGGKINAARRAVVGHDKAARYGLGLWRKYGQFGQDDPLAMRVVRCDVNGAPGLVFFQHGQPLAVLAFSVHDGRITEIDAVVNPDKLRHVPALPDPGETVV